MNKLVCLMKRMVKISIKPPERVVFFISRWTAATGIPLLFAPRLRGSDGTRYNRFVLPNVAVGVVKFSVLVLAT